MLLPNESTPVIKIKRFHTDLDSKVNEWLLDMRMKIKVLDIQVSPGTICVIYQSFTGEENEN